MSADIGCIFFQQRVDGESRVWLFFEKMKGLFTPIGVIPKFYWGNFCGGDLFLLEFVSHKTENIQSNWESASMKIEHVVLLSLHFQVFGGTVWVSQIQLLLPNVAIEIIMVADFESKRS